MMNFNLMIASALVLLATITNAHMIMKTPAPYSAQNLDNSPLTPMNYPCKLTGDPSTFYARTSATKMSIGQEQTLSFTGSAVHGGGSCQLAITSDLQPSKTTHWQVILSIEGGCPSTGGEGPSEYSYTIPDGIAPGQYSLAWTWISKLAGQAEYYMNCAPIEVAGGASKRSLNNSMEIESLMKRDALPDLFVANLAGINDCKAGPGVDPVFPNPGPTVQKPEGKRDYQEVTGSNCCPEGKCMGGTGGNKGAAPASAATSGQPLSSATDGLTVKPFTATGALLSSSAAAFTNKTSSPTGFVTSVIATSSNPAASSAPKSAAASAVATGSASSSSSSSGSSAGGLSGPCTSEGMFNCDGKSYQQCASGAWTAMRPLAAGVSCKQGQSMTLWRRKAF